MTGRPYRRLCPKSNQRCDCGSQRHRRRCVELIRESPVPLDRARLREILGSGHSYYGGAEPRHRNDDRLNLAARDFIASQLRTDMRVLDVGCGNGSTLRAHCDRFGTGVGIDSDERHLALAEHAKGGRGARNVDFVLLDIGDLPTRFPGEDFDSSRSPSAAQSAMTAGRCRRC